MSNEATPARSKVSLDHVVSTFGSEKQKKRYSAAKRNRLETDALETALATAVAHVQNEADKEEAGSCTGYCGNGVNVFLCYIAPLQSSGIMPLHNPLAERPQDVYNLEDSILYTDSYVVNVHTCITCCCMASILLLSAFMYFALFNLNVSPLSDYTTFSQESSAFSQGSHPIWDWFLERREKVSKYSSNITSI